MNQTRLKNLLIGIKVLELGQASIVLLILIIGKLLLYVKMWQIFYTVLAAYCGFDIRIHSNTSTLKY